MDCIDIYENEDFDDGAAGIVSPFSIIGPDLVRGPRNRPLRRKCLTLFRPNPTNYAIVLTLLRHRFPTNIALCNYFDMMHRRRCIRTEGTANLFD